jgi:hypothetical protein
MMLTLVWVTLRPVPTLGIVYLWPLSPLTGTLVGDEARGYLEGNVLVCEESADEFQLPWHCVLFAHLGAFLALLNA